MYHAGRQGLREEHPRAADEIEVPIRERQRGGVRHGKGAAGRCVAARGLDIRLPLVHADDLADVLREDIGERPGAAADVERTLGPRERREPRRLRDATPTARGAARPGQASTTLLSLRPGAILIPQASS